MRCSGQGSDVLTRLKRRNRTVFRAVKYALIAALAYWIFILLRVTAPGLDNPFWTCLATRHAHLALGGPLACRYPPDISPIGGMSGVRPQTSLHSSTLVEVARTLASSDPTSRLVAALEVLHASELTQMWRIARTCSLRRSSML